MKFWSDRYKQDISKPDTTTIPHFSCEDTKAVREVKLFSQGHSAYSLKVTARVYVADVGCCIGLSQPKILPQKSARESRILFLGSFIWCSDVIIQKLLESVHSLPLLNFSSSESNITYLVVVEII